MLAKNETKSDEDEQKQRTAQTNDDQEAPKSTNSLSSTSPTAAATALSPSIPTSQHRRIFKIIVIGDSNVGKTCLTYRFCGGRFLERSEATIGVDFREKTVQIDDELIKLQIWDTGSLL